MRLDNEIGPDGVAAHRYVYDLCPVNFVTPEHHSVLALFRLWRQGKMLENGGIGEQPARYIDMMMLLDAWWSDAEKDALERASQKRGK